MSALGNVASAGSIFGTAQRFAHIVRRSYHKRIGRFSQQLRYAAEPPRRANGKNLNATDCTGNAMCEAHRVTIQ